LGAPLLRARPCHPERRDRRHLQIHIQREAAPAHTDTGNLPLLRLSLAALRALNIRSKRHRTTSATGWLHMVLARISKSIEPEWLSFSPVRVGPIAAGSATPDRYVTLADGDRKLFRVDVYAYGPDCFAFQDAIVWSDHIFVGFGSHVHAICLRDRMAKTVALGAYYGHMYPTADYLLVASGERLFRIDPDRSVAWKSDVLAIDGVVVSNPEPPIIVGSGEWDPPGGWRPFSVFASNGESASAEQGDF
jgi:hypothetical protein